VAHVNRPARSADADRRRRLGRIHHAKKALGLCDREYRALLMRATSDEHGIGGIDTSGSTRSSPKLWASSLSRPE